MSALDILITYKDAFAQGLLTTFQLAAIVWVGGLLLGSLLGVLAARYKVPIGIPSRFISFTLSGMPILVFLFWLHYPMQSLLGIVVDPFITAAVTLTLVNIFAVSDVVRNVLSDFPAQYVTAAQVCGMTPAQITVHVELPIVLRQVVPLMLMIQVNMLQATLFASLISVNDIFRVAQQINSQIYRPVEIYTALGILFLAVCLPMNGLAISLKRKYTRDFSEH
jgi:polar amino acid transport system permease protein